MRIFSQKQLGDLGRNDILGTTGKTSTFQSVIGLIGLFHVAFGKYFPVLMGSELSEEPVRASTKHPPTKTAQLILNKVSNIAKITEMIPLKTEWEEQIIGGNDTLNPIHQGLKG